MVHFKFTALLPLDPTAYFLERDSDAFRALLARSLRLGSLDVVDGRVVAVPAMPAADPPDDSGNGGHEAPAEPPSTSGRGAAADGPPARRLVEAYTFVTRPDPLAFVAPHHRARLGAILPGASSSSPSSTAGPSPPRLGAHPPSQSGLAYTDVITYDPALLPPGGPYRLPVASLPPRILASAATVASTLTIAQGPTPGTTLQTLEGDVAFRLPLGMGRLIEAGVVDNLRRVYGSLPSVGAAWAAFRAEALALPRGGELLLSGRPLTAGVGWVAAAVEEVLASAGARTPGEGCGDGGCAPTSPPSLPSPAAACEVDGDLFFDAVGDGEDDAALLEEEEEEEEEEQATARAPPQLPAKAWRGATAAAAWPLGRRGRAPPASSPSSSSSPAPLPSRSLSRSVSPPRPLPTAAVTAAAAAAVRSGSGGDENAPPVRPLLAADATLCPPPPPPLPPPHPIPALWFAAGPASPAAAAAAGDGAAAGAAWRAFWLVRGSVLPASSSPSTTVAPGLAAARALSGMLSLLPSAAICCGPPGGGVSAAAAPALPLPAVPPRLAVSPPPSSPPPTAGHVRSDSASDGPAILKGGGGKRAAGGGTPSPGDATPPPRAVGGGRAGAGGRAWWARLFGPASSPSSPFGRAPRSPRASPWACWAGRPGVV